uniref:Uncharacterized protein n=1 Tax=Anopheles darlingi TaxID=43151 RepID=A0A2M4DC92_ANODA
MTYLWRFLFMFLFRRIILGSAHFAQMSFFLTKFANVIFILAFSKIVVSFSTTKTFQFFFLWPFNLGICFLNSKNCTTL